MRQSYTLVIPTYNRPESLARLLRYLKSQNADFLVHVLDSSRPEEREQNRRTVEKCGLDCKHFEFPEDTHPFDKFREGIAAVKTPLCALCADDDIPIVEGTRASVNFLLENTDYGTAHGYYFQFAMVPGELRLANFTYYTPSYLDGEPLARVHALMRHYQALTYATYRTNVLLKVFDTVRPVESILARELLSSVLAAIEGKVARLPVIYHGRSLGPSSSYQNWHPLEWLLSDADGLFEEYRLYRSLLVQTVMEQPDNSYSKEDAGRITDLVHMQYLMRHTPEQAFDHMITEALRGTTPDDIFRSRPVVMGLVRAASQFVPVDGKSEPKQSAQPVGAVSPAPIERNSRAEIVRVLDKHAPALATRLRRIKAGIGTGGDSKVRAAPSQVASETTPPAINPEMDTAVRKYRLAPAFINPPADYGIEVGDQHKLALIKTLDGYRD